MKYKRILLRLTMKNGLEFEAPVTRSISGAVSWAIRAAAVALVISVILYGAARLITALPPLVEVLTRQ